jgi:hypothetical protein
LLEEVRETEKAAHFQVFNFCNLHYPTNALPSQIP